MTHRLISGLGVDSSSNLGRRSRSVSQGVRLYGNYNTLSALVAAHSTSSGGCEQILGITFCDDESTSFSEREFYKIGVGPIGYSLDTSFSSSGGGFFTSSQNRIRIELIDTSCTANDGTAFNLPPYEELAPLNTPRQQHRAYVSGGKIYVFAGFDANSNTLNSVEVYDPVTNTWSFSTPSTAGSYGPGGAIEGLIYLPDFLSDTFRVFNPTTQTWTSVTPLSGKLPSMCDAANYSDVTFGFNEILVGANCNSFLVGALSFSGYSPSANNTLVSLGLPLGLAELLRFTVEVVGDKMFVIGGFGSPVFFAADRGARSDVWEFDILTDEWNPIANGAINVARDDHSSVVLADKIYVFGGAPVSCSDLNPSNCSRGNTLRDAEIYDPATGSSVDLPPMFTPREGFETVVLDGNIYLIGGDDGDGVTGKVDRYIP